MIPISDDSTLTCGMAVLNNRVYTVGNYKGEVDFTFNNNNIINNFGTTANSNQRGFILRNDHQFNGMFKSLSEESRIVDSLTNEIIVYPNPSNGNFIVENITDKEQIQIVDILGKEVPFSLSRSENEVYINLGSHKGIAILKTSKHCIRLIVK